MIYVYPDGAQKGCGLGVLVVSSRTGVRKSQSLDLESRNVTVRSSRN